MLKSALLMVAINAIFLGVGWALGRFAERRRIAYFLRTNRNAGSLHYRVEIGEHRLHAPPRKPL